MVAGSSLGVSAHGSRHLRSRRDRNRPARARGRLYRQGCAGRCGDRDARCAIASVRGIPCADPGRGLEVSPAFPSGPQAALVRFAIPFRGIVAALACVLVAYGVYALGHAKYDGFPEFGPPQVGIQGEAVGLTPEQVEVLVTRPIENAINGVPGVQTLRSTSIQGLSIVTVFFDPSGDIYRDRQVVAERLAVAAQQLPQGAQPPAMTPLTSSTCTRLVIGLSSERRSLMDLRPDADWTIRLRLLSVPGVAKVVVFGGDVRSIQVQVHPSQLIQYNLGLNDVLTAARRATGVRGAGFIDTKNQRL